MPGVPGMETDPLASPHLWCPSCSWLVLTQVWFPAVSVPFYPLQCDLLSLINSGKFVLPTFGSLSELVVLLCFLSWCVHATTWAQGPPPLPIFPEPPRTHFKTGEPQEENVWSWEKDGVIGAAPTPTINMALCWLQNLQKEQSRRAAVQLLGFSRTSKG